MPLFCLALLAYLQASNSAEPPTPSDTTALKLSGPLGKPIQLFNGKDLTGWVWYQRPPKPGETTPVKAIDEVWDVKDGLLHTTGKPIGYIRTEKSFDNYMLTVEQRHVKKGNGGVLFGITGPDKVWPHSLEVQGANGEEGDIRNVRDFKLTMDLDRVEPARLKRVGPDPEKPAGEWETIQLIVDGPNVSVTVNGVFQNSLVAQESLAGQIGLQAEGGEMEFRKIELQPIEKAWDKSETQK
jgi:hypothetical protein